MKSGATRTILRRAPSTTTFSNSARSWRRTPLAPSISERYMAWDTNSSADAREPTSRIRAPFFPDRIRGCAVAMQTNPPGFTREAAEKYFQQSLDDDRGESCHWWLGEHHLYQSFIEPIYRGSRTDGT